MNAFGTIGGGGERGKMAVILILISRPKPVKSEPGLKYMFRFCYTNTVFTILF